MEKEKVIKKGRMPRERKKDIVISIRINQDMADFIDKNNFSIPLIFREALSELGFKSKHI